jgi:hypothetical protein
VLCHLPNISVLFYFRVLNSFLNVTSDYIIYTFNFDFVLNSAILSVTQKFIKS